MDVRGLLDPRIGPIAPHAAPSRQSSSVKPPIAIALLWEEGQRRLAAQSERLSRLDSKTTPLLGFGVAAAAFFQSNASKMGDAARFGVVLAGLGILCTLAVMAPRTFSYAPRFRTLLKSGNRDPDELKTRYLGNLRTAIDENDDALEAKTKWFQAAIYIYVGTIAAAVGGILGSHG